MSLNNIIIRPIVSEKSNMSRESDGKYTFVTNLNADKKQVAKAVESLFGVNVVKVNSLITRGKLKEEVLTYILARRRKSQLLLLLKGKN